MNPQIQELREQRLKRADQDVTAQQSQQIVQGLAKLDQTTVQAVSALIEYLQGSVTRTEVVNQLDSVRTPDSMKVMSAVNDMHATLKKLKIPQTEKNKEVAISNLSTLENKLDGLETAINKLNNKKIPAPQVKVDAAKPPEVTVQPTDVQVDIDIKPIQKELQKLRESVEKTPVEENSLISEKFDEWKVIEDLFDPEEPLVTGIEYYLDGVLVAKLDYETDDGRIVGVKKVKL